MLIHHWWDYPNRFVARGSTTSMSDEMIEFYDDGHEKTAERDIEFLCAGYITANPKETYNTIPKECWYKTSFCFD